MIESPWPPTVSSARLPKKEIIHSYIVQIMRTENGLKLCHEVNKRWPEKDLLEGIPLKGVWRTGGLKCCFTLTHVPQGVNPLPCDAFIGVCMGWTSLTLRNTNTEVDNHLFGKEFMVIRGPMGWNRPKPTHPRDCFLRLMLQVPFLETRSQQSPSFFWRRNVKKKQPASTRGSLTSVPQNRIRQLKPAEVGKKKQSACRIYGIQWVKTW